MKNNICIVLTLLLVCFVGYAYCEQGARKVSEVGKWNKVSITKEKRRDLSKIYKSQSKKDFAMDLDEATINELHNFFIATQDLTYLDFQLNRDRYLAASIIERDFKRRYSHNGIVKSGGVKNRKHKEIIKLYEKEFRRQREISKGCLDYSQSEKMNRYNKILNLRNKMASKARKNNNFRYTDEYISINENILSICKHNNMWSSLLNAYRIKAENDKRYKKKYKDMVLRLINEDQVEHNYAFNLTGEVNNRFREGYVDYLRSSISKDKEIIPTKDDVILLADSLTGKHQAVFDFSSDFYRLDTEEYFTREACDSLAFMSILIDYYGLQEYSVKFNEVYGSYECVERTRNWLVKRLQLSL